MILSYYYIHIYLNACKSEQVTVIFQNLLKLTSRTVFTEAVFRFAQTSHLWSNNIMQRCLLSNEQLGPVRFHLLAE